MGLQECKKISNKHIVTFELVDLSRYDLPCLGILTSPEQEQKIQKWSQKMASFDGYIFVTPEYNHAVLEGFKNTLDFLTVEVKDKAVGFLGYGFLDAG